MFRSLQRQLAVATISLLSTFVTADETARQASDGAAGPETPVLRLNVSTSGYPPYLIVSPDHEYSGIAYDVVTRIAERMGYRVEPLEIPRKRVDNLLQEGVIDATLRAPEWTKEPDNFLFTDTIVPVREVFFTPTGSNFRFRSLDTLRNVTIATPLGYQYPQLKPLFDSGAVERLEVSRDRDIFTFMLHGENIDAAVADLLVGRWLIRQNGWQDKFRHSDRAISELDYRLMVRPEWAPFAEAFNEELEKMKASGELDEILDQYR